MAILIATDVWKSYVDEQFVLRSVRLTLDEAEFASIQGRSGAGKSTLLRVVGLLEKMDQGELHPRNSQAATTRKFRMDLKFSKHQR